MNDYRPGSFSILPDVVKNLIIINGLMLFATITMESMGINLRNLLGLHYFESELFQPYQIVTYLFMHGDLMHLFFNMFAIWMFGSTIENYWGPKRFLTYYIITGIGASVLHYAIAYVEMQPLIAQMSPEIFHQKIVVEGAELIANGRNYHPDHLPLLSKLNRLFNSGLVGASGSLFGILLAYGMLFPNTKLFMLFIPFPIKAKYLVAGYGAMELIYGLQNNPNDNVAHFAHLGGMLFGYLLIKYWRSNSKFS